MIGPDSRNQRQHPRTRVSWPVVVETGTHRYPCEVTDISNRGAKVMTREQLETGSVVRLQIVAPDGAALRVGAWCGELMPTGWRSLSPAASTIASPSSQRDLVRVGARLLPRHSPSGGRKPKLRGCVLAHQKCGPG